MTSLTLACQVDTLDSTSDKAYDALLNFADLVSRTIRNRLVSPVYRLLYLSLVDLHPEILDGQRVAVQIWKVREGAGWPAKESATKFLQDLQAIGAIIYEPGKFNPSEEDRVGYITANMDVFPYPEQFNTKDTENRRKARAAEEKKRKQFKNPLQLFQCQECGSNNLTYDATAVCQDCHHVHDTIKNIPASLITIEAELIEIADEDNFLDTPTIQVKAVRQLPTTPIPAVLEQQQFPPDPDKFCRHCGRKRSVCFILTASGLWDMSCC